MKKEKINIIIKKYLMLFEKAGINKNQIDTIEEELSIILPKDFKEIANVFDGYTEIGGMSLFSFDTSVKGWNVIEKTKFYRASACSLPKCYLALREEGESFIVMKTQKNPSLDAPIIWCSLSDAYNLQDDTKLQDNPKIFPSFADFFEYLLDQEEEERKEKDSGLQNS